MEIFVKTLNGNSITLEVELSMDIFDVMLMIRDKTGCPIPQQRLIFAGKHLDDEKSVGFYNIGSEATLYMLTGCLRGRAGYSVTDSSELFARAQVTKPDSRSSVAEPLMADAWAPVAVHGPLSTVFQATNAAPLSLPNANGRFRRPTLLGNLEETVVDIYGSRDDIDAAQVAIDGTLLPELERWARTNILPSLAERFPVAGGPCDLHFFVLYENSTRRRAAAESPVPAGPVHYDLYELTLDICLSVNRAVGRAKDHGENIPCSSFSGGGFEVAQDEAFLPHLTAGSVYAWDQNFRHAARPIDDGMRVSLIVWVSPPNAIAGVRTLNITKPAAAKYALVLAILALFDLDGDFALSLDEVNAMNRVLEQPEFTDVANLREVARKTNHALTTFNAFPFTALVASYSDAELAGDISMLIRNGYLPPPDHPYTAAGTLTALGRMQVYGMGLTFLAESDDETNAALTLAEVNEMNSVLGQPAFTAANLAAFAAVHGTQLDAEGRLPFAALIVSYEHGEDRGSLASDVDMVVASRRLTKYGFGIGDLKRSLFTTAPLENSGIDFGISFPCETVPGRSVECSQTSDECVICRASQRVCALVPCGHVCVCEEDAVLLSGQSCPLCRSPVVSALRVYY